MRSHHQLLHFVNFLSTAQILGPTNLHKNCCVLSLFCSFFSYCNISTTKRGDREQGGKQRPCRVERQPSSRERRSFANMTSSTRTSPKGLTTCSTRQQFHVSSKDFKPSECRAAAATLQASEPGRVSPACPAAPADPATRKPGSNKRALRSLYSLGVVTKRGHAVQL